MNKYMNGIQKVAFSFVVFLLTGCTTVSIKESTFLKNETQALIYQIASKGPLTTQELLVQTSLNKAKLLQKLEKLESNSDIYQKSGRWHISEAYREESSEYINAIEQFDLDTEQQLALPHVLSMYKLPNSNVEVASFVYPEADTTMIVFGGNGFNLIPDIQQIREKMLLNQSNLFVMNYPGMGESSELTSIKNITRSSEAFFHHVRSLEEVKDTKLVVYGFSLGGFVATNIASTGDVEGLILDSTAPDISAWVDANVPVLAKPFVNIEIEPSLVEVSNSKVLKNINCAILFIGGEKDKITPVSFISELELASNNALVTKKVILDGAAHGETLDHHKYKETIQSFIESL